MSQIKSATILGTAIAAIMLVPACSSDDNGSTAAGPLTYDSFVDQFCALHTPCCALASRPTDGKACKATFQAFKPVVDFNPEAARTCLNQTTAAKADPRFCANFPQTFAACNQATYGKRGAKPLGASCNSTFDCAQPAGTSTACTAGFSDSGICQQEITVGAGDGPCAGVRIDGGTIYDDSDETRLAMSIKVCDEGLNCNAQTKLCEPGDSVPVKSCDPASDDSDQCGRKARCSAQTRTCVPRQELGQACGSSDDCIEARGFCDPQTRVCTATRVAGAACTDNDECAGYCQKNVCTGDLATDTRIFCTSFSSDCLSDEYCDSQKNKCILRKPIGATCNGPEACVSTAFCALDTGLCTAKRPLGAACRDRSECAEECTNGKCTVDLGLDLKWSFACGGD